MLFCFVWGCCSGLFLNDGTTPFIPLVAGIIYLIAFEEGLRGATTKPHVDFITIVGYSAVAYYPIFKFLHKLLKTDKKK
jgi:hypothetical protein